MLQINPLSSSPCSLDCFFLLPFLDTWSHSFHIRTSSLNILLSLLRVFFFYFLYHASLLVLDVMFYQYRLEFTPGVYFRTFLLRFIDSKVMACHKEIYRLTRRVYQLVLWMYFIFFCQSARVLVLSARSFVEIYSANGSFHHSLCALLRPPLPVGEHSGRWYFVHVMDRNGRKTLFRYNRQITHCTLIYFYPLKGH